jgi:hypothetical protein
MIYDNAVGTATDYGLDGRGHSSSSNSVKNCHFSPPSKPALRSTQSIMSWIGSFSEEGEGGNPGREADHSPPTSAEIKKTFIYRVGQTQLGSFWSLITNQSNNTRENGKVPFVVDRWQA